MLLRCAYVSTGSRWQEAQADTGNPDLVDGYNSLLARPLGHYAGEDSNNAPKTTEFHVVSHSGGAESGALSHEDSWRTPEFDAIRAAWPKLPEAVKAGILALAKVATETKA